MEFKAPWVELGTIGHCEQFGHCGHSGHSGQAGLGQLLSLPIANSSSLVMTMVVVRMKISMLVIQLEWKTFLLSTHTRVDYHDNLLEGKAMTTLMTIVVVMINLTMFII